MTNVLNNIIANQPIKSARQAELPSFTFNSEGKIRPLEDKAKLLPSRIFGSPVEYVKDLKQDVVNIGKAVKGKANDHELGRINDVAMKLGSLGLATYLCIKNPLKLSKTMEFVGVGTFFTSMALWPKLAIQAPLKARTGVDIHQKYIDSQGRKKMLHQDPQYDLTDLYSREDLDKMGKKLGVAENLPDRDNFIKQRAKKTALQGNTLWMMTAGIATPVMSALACNRLEGPINNAIEAFDLKSSQKVLETGKQGFIAKIKQSKADKAFDKFLRKHAGEVLDSNMAKKLSVKMGSGLNSASMQSTLEKELTEIAKSLTFNDFTESFVADALRGKIDDALIASLSSQQRAQLENALAGKSFKSVAAVLANAASANGGGNANKLRMGYEKALDSAKKAAEKELASQSGTVGAFSEKIKTLYSSIGGLTRDKQILDKYIDARVGERSGSYIANQWTRVTTKLLKSLNIKDKELLNIGGNNTLLADKFTALAADEKAYNKAVKEIMKLVQEYEQTAGQGFVETVKGQTSNIATSVNTAISGKGFDEVAKKFVENANGGTLKSIVDSNAKNRMQGAQSSFYRMLQTLDIFKRAQNGSLKEQLSNALIKNGITPDDGMIKRLTKLCKDVVLDATTTDHIEKLTSAKFGVNPKEYKVVMDMLYGDGACSAIKDAMGTETFKGFRDYADDFIIAIANWQNDKGINPTIKVNNYCRDGIKRAKRVAQDLAANPTQRNNLVGKPVRGAVADIAKQTYNSHKWLKIFGGTMAVLTAVTLIAGLVIGRKSKMEKQAEEESKKING